MNTLSESMLLKTAKVPGNMFFGIFVFVLLISAFYRITIGVDLSDEAYYATYLDGWLKLGLTNSQNLTIHQTAAFLVFPFAYLYTLIMGSEIGLILFLRVIYVLMSLGATLILFSFVQRLRGELVAALVSGFCFLFIPWSLPTPSYNTIGMFGMLAAILLFGIAVLNLNERQSTNRVIFFSAVLWMFAVIAYPSLFVAFSGFICMAYLFLGKMHERFFVVRYALICIGLLVCGLGLLFWVFGSEHLMQMLKFTDATLQVSGGIPRKLDKTVELLAQNKKFLVFCIFSFCAGIALAIFHARDRVVLILCIVMGGVIFYSMAFQAPVFFLQSHDIILLLALFGVFIPLTAGIPHVVKIMYGSSIIAGLVTAITATNGFFNFPIGGLLAACLSLSFFPTKIFSIRVAHIVLVLMASIVMVVSSYKFIYGEIYGHPLRVPATRMDSGVFFGLRTSTEQAVIINKISALLPQQCTEQRSIAVVGRAPGIYLLTCLAPSVLTTAWRNQGYIESEANVLMIRKFYEIEQNQPDMIFSFRDRWTEPLTITEKALMTTKYHLIKQERLGETEMFVYQKNRNIPI